jgi:hypothetical protein
LYVAAWPALLTTYDPQMSQSGDIAAWLQAIGALLAVPVAVVAVIFAAKAFRAQSDQLRDQRDLVRQQAKELQAAHDDREREATERRRAQAAQVFMELDYKIVRHPETGQTTTVSFRFKLRNTSAQPVYQVVIRWFQGTAPWSQNGVDHHEFRRLMPDPDGLIILERNLAPTCSNLDSYGAVAEFRDAASIRWRTTNDGRFEELP